MKKCVFTIVAKNYIGLAKILGLSLEKYDTDIKFYIFVADEFDKYDQHINVTENVIQAKDVTGYSEDEWTDMTFKYDLTEFCTAIKPACFQYIFRKGYDYAIYFDPDVFIFSSINDIFLKLETYDVVLTPQIADIHIDFKGEHPEWAMNVNGIFNLGFCGMHNTSITRDVLMWWRTRLIDNCFADRTVGNFTDQKWMDWMPGFLGNDHLYVFHSLGMNMAPWNFFERELFTKGDNIYVKNRCGDVDYHEDKLMFIHFAGYDYQKMKNGIISRKRIEELNEYEDLIFATDIYRKALMDNKILFDEFINKEYSYSKYENGDTVMSFHRRLYHGYVTSGVKISRPFSTKRRSFYYFLKKNGMIKDPAIDKINQRNIHNIENKRKMIGILFKILYKLMGYKRYVLFVKSLYNYCRPEFHTFLIKL